MNIGLIKIFKKDEDFIEKYKNVNNVYYKSIRGLLSDRKIYASQSAWEKDTPVNHRFELTPCSNLEEIADNLESFHVLKKLD